MGIKVNVSERESQAGDRAPLPVGRYHVAVVDVRLDSPQQGENIGKPMLVFTNKVQESEFTRVPGHEAKEFFGQNDFVNACLWDGALYTIVAILKAIGEYENCLDSSGELDVPTEPEFYLGRQMLSRRATNSKARQRYPDNPDWWINTSGFSPLPQAEGQGSGTPVDAREGALLP